MGDGRNVSVAVRGARRGDHPRYARPIISGRSPTSRGVEIARDRGFGHGKLVEELWEDAVGVDLWAPTFVRDFPVETSPLTREHRSIPGVTEKWDLYIRNFELATGYTELIDPVVQRERFEAQARAAAAGDDEAMVLDEDFLAALEYGMPPTTGTGMGIDRLLMALTGLSIRETVLFPLVRRDARRQGCLKAFHTFVLNCVASYASIVQGFERSMTTRPCRRGSVSQWQKK